MKTSRQYQDWSLFLDRDGVINHRIVGKYTKNWEEFIFLEGVLEAMSIFSATFSHIFIVTNQQGVGKGIMTQADLDEIHQKMCTMIEKKGGRIDKVYASTGLAIDNPPCRKPNTGMGVQAKKEFPTIDFNKSIMVGDSISDIQFGKKLGMKTILIEGKEEEDSSHLEVDYRFNSLYKMATSIT